MKLLPQKPIIVAIDPGTNTGIAFWRRRDEKIFHSETTDFYDAQLLIARTFPDNRGKIIAGQKGRNEKQDLHIYIERPGRILYGRNQHGSIAEQLDIASKVGGTRREAELMHKCLMKRGYECSFVLPINEAKWTYDECVKYTGNRKRTSEHERDAIRIAIYYATHKKELKRR